MSDFSVNTVTLLKEADTLKTLKNELRVKKFSLDRIRHSLILQVLQEIVLNKV